MLDKLKHRLAFSSFVRRIHYLNPPPGNARAADRFKKEVSKVLRGANKADVENLCGILRSSASNDGDPLNELGRRELAFQLSQSAWMLDFSPKAIRDLVEVATLVPNGTNIATLVKKRNKIPEDIDLNRLFDAYLRKDDGKYSANDFVYFIQELKDLSTIDGTLFATGIIPLLERQVLGGERLSRLLQLLQNEPRSLRPDLQDRLSGVRSQHDYTLKAATEAFTKRTAGMSDAEIVMCLRDLCQAYTNNDRPQVRSLEPIARAIGEALNARGGFEEMRRVFAMLENQSGSRTLDMHWEGIGDWRG